LWSHQTPDNCDELVKQYHPNLPAGRQAQDNSHVSYVKLPFGKTRNNKYARVNSQMLESYIEAIPIMAIYTIYFNFKIKKQFILNKIHI